MCYIYICTCVCSCEYVHMPVNIHVHGHACTCVYMGIVARSQCQALLLLFWITLHLVFEAGFLSELEADWFARLAGQLTLEVTCLSSVAQCWSCRCMPCLLYFLSAGIWTQVHMLTGQAHYWLTVPTYRFLIDRSYILQRCKKHCFVIASLPHSAWQERLVRRGLHHLLSVCLKTAYYVLKEKKPRHESSFQRLPGGGNELSGN